MDNKRTKYFLYNNRSWERENYNPPYSISGNIKKI
jgi:hypothetical protein